MAPVEVIGRTKTGQREGKLFNCLVIGGPHICTVGLITGHEGFIVEGDSAGGGQVTERCVSLGEVQENDHRVEPREEVEIRFPRVTSNTDLVIKVRGRAPGDEEERETERGLPIHLYRKPGKENRVEW